MLSKTSKLNVNLLDLEALNQVIHDYIEAEMCPCSIIVFLLNPAT